MTDAPSEPLSGQPKPRRRWFDLGSLPRAERTLVLACILFWSVLSFLFFSHFVLQAGEVEGDSMVPTMQDGQRYIIWRLLTLFRAPERGEIICFRMPGEEAYTVKRVIALPGEVVQVRGGRVHVGGVLLEEPYLVSGMRSIVSTETDILRAESPREQLPRRRLAVVRVSPIPPARLHCVHVHHSL